MSGERKPGIDIAVVEDDDVYAHTLQEYLNRLGTETGMTLQAVRFSNAEDFMESRPLRYGLVLMDIELPGMDGMTAAHRLREMDDAVVIVFITNMKQYAIKGYEVQALDFIVKPIRYKDFSQKIGRALRKCANMTDQQILVPMAVGYRRVSNRELMYAEVMDHKLIYHLTEGEIVTRMSMKSAEPVLAQAGFLRCNNCYMVNPRFISAVDSSVVYVGGHALKISKPRRKEFMQAWANWLAGGREA